MRPYAGRGPPLSQPALSPGGARFACGHRWGGRAGGEINGQRIALPQAFERVDPTDSREVRLWRIILKNVNKRLAADEIVVVDAGVKIRDLQTASDETHRWEEEGRTLRTEIWRNLVLPDCAPDAHNPTFDVYAIYDPRFDTP